ncbi:succinate dehydrogenase assembly factor 2 [Methylobrevis pamukkalensis]|uniref:FAD assembly factor SdhE n=1 Tax=Methylobrevis pamukkalensis TaxID=1439726 RepID=A0A1E3H3D1_9HYPH|nr:succinate dehydrogenase assembly factor 2 [Methylobrevis pamukkalensis]ODN70833.1 Flavinator of succinate dehydrogenase [Methylobrevis pamukkalensis]
MNARACEDERTFPDAEDLSPRRRRILYHSWHRGTREMDLLLGRFVDSAIGDLPEADLDRLEELMEVEDKLLFAWIIGREPPPPEHDGPTLARIISFHRANPLALD